MDVLNGGGPPALVISNALLTNWAGGTLLTLFSPAPQALGEPMQHVPVLTGFLDEKIAFEMSEMLANLVSSFPARPKKD